MALSVPSGDGQRTAPIKTREISENNPFLLERLGNYPDLETLAINCIDGLGALPDSIGKLENGAAGPAEGASQISGDHVAA
jgi:hypothetical protein